MLSHSGLSPVEYSFEAVIYSEIKKKKASGEKKISFPANEMIGKKLRLSATGEIRCTDCGDLTKKSFNQGSCFKCFMNLASNDLCIMKPETCHFHLGTCREPEWGKANCFKKHTVYLANSSGLKVGITKENPVTKRWVDQGASQALAMFEVETRLDAGLVEIEFAKYISDKTSWQKLIAGDATKIDLVKEKQKLLETIDKGKIKSVKDVKPNQIEIQYPINSYPKKKVSIKPEPNKPIEDTLLGIKGQYLLWENGVTNIRSYGGYFMKLEVV
jgi:Protein of unknown function (DUF2797)